MIDARLAKSQTDGWRYADMPEDGQAWRASLAALRADGFASATEGEQDALIQAVQDAEAWHGMPAARVWSLWTRYACTALYARDRNESAWLVRSRRSI
jgi:Gluconate 2-dehydrogenase subunit 3